MISPAKAKKILHDGKVHGKSLTPSQRKFFGARASGYPMMKYTTGGKIEIGSTVHIIDSDLRKNKIGKSGVVTDSGGRALWVVKFIDDSSAVFKNNQLELIPKLGEGGRIEDIYTKGTARDLWDKGWDTAQRTHFLIDHYDMFSTEIESDVNKYAQKFSHSSYADLPEPIKKQIVIHHAMGFYGGDGRIENSKSPAANSKLQMKYLTPAKKLLSSKITSIKEKMQKVKDPQVLKSLEQHIQKLETILNTQTPTHKKIEKWKQQKTAKRLSRSK